MVSKKRKAWWSLEKGRGKQYEVRLVMGIRHLNKFMRRRIPKIFVTDSLEKWKHKKIAVDVTVYLYRFKAKGDSWLKTFCVMFTWLQSYDINAICIFDGSSPMEKKGECDKRADRRRTDRLDLLRLESALLKGEDLCAIELVSGGVFPGEDALAKLEELREKNRFPTRKDFILLQKLLKTLGVPYMHAPEEAEALCSCLCRRGHVDAVMSEDTDLYAYGTPVVLTALCLQSGTITSVSFADLLLGLRLTHEQFVDLCTLYGTDYNQGVSGVSQASCYRLIQIYKTIEVVRLRTTVARENLNKDAIRRIFLPLRTLPASTRVPYNGFPEILGVSRLLRAGCDGQS